MSEPSNDLCAAIQNRRPKPHHSWSLVYIMFCILFTKVLSHAEACNPVDARRLEPRNAIQSLEDVSKWCVVTMALCSYSTGLEPLNEYKSRHDPILVGPSLNFQEILRSSSRVKSCCQHWQTIHQRARWLAVHLQLKSDRTDCLNDQPGM